MEAVIFIGVQGAGKTTFYKARFFDTHIRISRDLLKTRNRERLLVNACLAARQPFVVDNTNALRSQRAEFIASAKLGGFRVIGYYFQCELKELLRRNRERPTGQIVPPAGVISTYKRLELPLWSEGFDDLKVIEITAGNQFVMREWPKEQES
jgi:predicted kinase